MSRLDQTARQGAGSFITMALLGALALAGGFADANAQGNKSQALEVFEAAKEPPPEHAALERAAKEQPAAPARARPNVDELVGQIARQRGGKERLERARKGGRPEHAIAASRREPPDAAEVEKQKPPAPPRSRRPTRQELEQAISRQEGGRGKLDRARQGGRPDKPPRTTAMQRVAEWFDWFPDLIASAHAAGELSVTLTPEVNSYGAHGGLAASGGNGLYAYALIRGAYVHSSTPSNTYVYAVRHQMTWDSNTQSKGERPYVYLSLRVPRDGYYIVNTRAYGPAGIQLRRYRYPDYPIVQSFDASGTVDRPALVYLTEGYHYFYWVSPSVFVLYSASVDSYP